MKKRKKQKSPGWKPTCPGPKVHRLPKKKGFALSALIILIIVALALLVPAFPAKADYGSGCPVWAFAGMKVFEDDKGNQIPHPGQWFTVTYPGAICGANEVNAVWVATRVDRGAPFVTDTCFSALDYLLTQEAGEKSCGRRHGKIFYIATPGVYNITATCPNGPAGPGSWTIENFRVD